MSFILENKKKKKKKFADKNFYKLVLPLKGNAGLSIDYM